MFPNLIDRSCYNKRRRKLAHFIRMLQQRTAEGIAPDQALHIIDSLPLPIRQFARAKRSKLCRETYETMDYAYCAWQKMTFYGYKLHAVITVGGGILIVPFMVYVCKYPTKFAAGSSHLIISFSALAGIIGHATSHRLDIPLIVVTGIAVLIGGNLGARVSMKVNTKMIRAGLGLLMWALAAQLLVKLL